MSRPTTRYKLASLQWDWAEAKWAAEEAEAAVNMHLYDLAKKLDVVLKMLPEGSEERRLLNEVVLELGE